MGKIEVVDAGMEVASVPAWIADVSESLFRAYFALRHTTGTGDLVLVVDDSEKEKCYGHTREKFLQVARNGNDVGGFDDEIGRALSEPAASPGEMGGFWLVLLRDGFATHVLRVGVEKRDAEGGCARAQA